MKRSSRAGMSTLAKLVILLPVLLIVAVAANYKDISDIIKGERTWKGVLRGKMDAGADMVAWTMPDDTGSEDAKVEIEMFLRAGDPCHAGFAFLGRALGKTDPDRIRIKFQNTAKPKARERFNELKIGCEQGMAINGNTKFDVPTADAPAVQEGRDQQGEQAESGEAETQVVYITGESHWSRAGLHGILDAELKEAYEGEGMKMDEAEFAQALKAEEERLMAEAKAEAERKAEGGESPAPGAFTPSPDSSSADGQ